MSARCLQNASKTRYCQLCTYKTLLKHRTVSSVATKRFKNAVQSALCPQNASKTPYYRFCACKTLRQHCSIGSVPTKHLGCTFEITIRIHWTLLLFTMFHTSRLGCTFEITFRNHYSNLLNSAPLNYVPHSTEHGYARVHSSIYIYIYMCVHP